MSAQAMGWALDQDLPARPKLVLVAIANHADHTDGYCWLKAKTIAAEAACTPRSVYRFVGGLIRNGYLRRMPRKGADGKQRATDYWILFNREPATWDWGAGLEVEDERESEIVNDETAGDGEASGGEAQDIDLEVSPESHGETTRPVTRSPENMHAESPGPSAIAVTTKNTAEPSKTNLKSGGLEKSPPRGYRPPPPQLEPVGSTTLGGTGEWFFAYENSRAYKAWAIRKAKETGIKNWHRVDWKVVNGQNRCGFWFPTLFPPPLPGEPDLSLASESELDQFAKTG